MTALTLTLTLILAYPNAVWSQTVMNPSLQNPRRIAEGPTGELLVTDRSGMIVAVDRQSLEPVWGYQLPLVPGDPLPQEGAPFGLATLKRLIFVGNTETKNVEVYRLLGGNAEHMDLRFKYNLGNIPAGETGSIENPIGIGVDRSAQLVFVLDGKAKKVKVFDTKGPFLYEFVPMDQDGAVLSPVSLAVDEINGEVLVGDYGDPSGGFAASEPARILTYDFAGNLLNQIDGSGYGGSNLVFARVQGIAVSADGRIFAADPLGSRILVFDRSSGTLLEVLGTAGEQPGQLMIPTDVILDPDTGDLFIVNNRGARTVEVIRGAGGPP